MSSHDTLHRPTSNPDDFESGINDSQANKKGKFSRRRITAGVALTALLAGGGGYAANRILGSDAEPTGDKHELVLGSDGKPLTYVEYSEDHLDRNHDGFNDNATDVNENGVGDQNENWNQLTGEFEDPRAGDDEAAYDSASAQDKANMQEILAAYPEMGDSEHWVSDFVALEQEVKDYMMVIVRNPDRYDNEQQWHIAILSALDVTAEELEVYQD